jgi:hypothetical protein
LLCKVSDDEREHLGVSSESPVSINQSAVLASEAVIDSGFFVWMDEQLAFKNRLIVAKGGC